MQELMRHQLVYKLLVPPVALFAKWRFNYVWDDLSRIEGPYLLLPNHNLELDPIFVGVATKKQLYFVASEHLTRKGFASKLLNHFFKPILRQKGTSGANTVAKILRTLRSGSSVCIFPEGNRSFNGLTGEILPATGKMARRSGTKLVTYRIEGGYLSQPRWGMSLRKGKLRGRLIHVYEPEELKAMTDQQVNDAIIRDLYEDAYATQANEMIPFKGKNLALGMETTVFTCPACGQIGTLHSSADDIVCSCGFRAAYDEYGYLTDRDGVRRTITELDQTQRTLLRRRIQAQPANTPLFSDRVTRQDIGEDHTLLSETPGELAAYTDHLDCCGRTIPFHDLQGMAIYSRNVLVLYTNSDHSHYEIRGEQMFSALKYQYWYEILREEG